jgi:hypothetical protein
MPGSNLVPLSNRSMRTRSVLRSLDGLLVRPRFERVKSKAEAKLRVARLEFCGIAEASHPGTPNDDRVISEHREPRDAFGLGIDGLAPTPWVFAPIGDEAPPDQIERALA